MASPVSLKKNRTDKVDLKKVTFVRPLENMPSMFRTALLTMAAAVVAVAKDAGLWALEFIELLNDLDTASKCHLSYETHKRHWIDRPGQTDSRGNARKTLGWLADQPLGELGAACLWAGEPSTVFDGVEFLNRAEALGFTFDKAEKEMFADEHKSMVAIDLRLGRNGRKMEGAPYPNAINPSDWVYNDDQAVFAEERLGRKGGAAVARGAGGQDLDSPEAGSQSDF